jgi:hypothetical protein
MLRVMRSDLHKMPVGFWTLAIKLPKRTGVGGSPSEPQG